MGVSGVAGVTSWPMVNDITWITSVTCVTDATGVTGVTCVTGDIEVTEEEEEEEEGATGYLIVDVIKQLDSCILKNRQKLFWQNWTFRLVLLFFKMSSHAENRKLQTMSRNKHSLSFHLASVWLYALQSPSVETLSDFEEPKKPSGPLLKRRRQEGVSRPRA